MRPLLGFLWEHQAQVQIYMYVGRGIVTIFESILFYMYNIIFILLQVDMVGRPSWQAQLSGKKTWILIPPPECEQYCSNLNVTVHKGDIGKL